MLKIYICACRNKFYLKEAKICIDSIRKNGQFNPFNRVLASANGSNESQIQSSGHRAHSRAENLHSPKHMQWNNSKEKAISSKKGQNPLKNGSRASERDFEAGGV